MCGVFGAYSARDFVAEDVYLGLSALQHRGQESAGVAWIDENRRVNVVKGMGLVHEALSQSVLANTPVTRAIGHVRYSTSGGSMMQNAQPICANYAQGPVAIAHNGNLTNFLHLRETLESRGAIFQSTSDTEVILHLLAHQSRRRPLDALLRALSEVRGAFSLVVLLEDGLVAARDPWGFRPLALGRRGDNYYVSSESCAFNLLGASFVRDIEAGEVLLINERGLTSYSLPDSSKMAENSKRRWFCSFEYVYFARPDSVIEGISVYRARQEMGRLLAKSVSTESSPSGIGVPSVDFVASLPDSGTTAALGYSQESGIPFEAAVVRNRYVGRTFIQPTQKVRELGVRIKLSPSPELFAGRKAVLVDDSIVRGTTAGLVVSMIRECNASEVHLRISSPPVRYPCFYGIDTPSNGDLAAAKNTLEDIARTVGADSLSYLSREDMMKAIGLPPDSLCTACFDGQYLDAPDVDGERCRCSCEKIFE
ncbi:MAG: amidophosphoribosyltransferase [Synergistaceae bacterium]|jgi:amidophosphoribosyltransferase|nr:amidophosphoribosyltransferase [Synergistaceae bacterium]